MIRTNQFAITPLLFQMTNIFRPTNNWLHMMVYICTTTPSLNFKNLNFMHFLLGVAMIFISARKFHCIQARHEDDLLLIISWNNYTALLEKSTTALSRRGPWSRWSTFLLNLCTVGFNTQCDDSQVCSQKMPRPTCFSSKKGSTWQTRM